MHANVARRKGLDKGVIVKKICNLRCTGKVFDEFVRQRVLSDMRLTCQEEGQE